VEGVGGGGAGGRVAGGGRRGGAGAGARASGGVGAGGGGRGRGAARGEWAGAERVADDGGAGAAGRWDGAVVSAGGTSARAHLMIAEEARVAYARMCSNVEGCRYGLPITRGGAVRYVARSIDFVLSRPIRDVPGFAEDAFTGKPPLRMEGKCAKIKDGLYSIPVVDLENAESLGISVTSKYMSMLISNDWPGASVLRLLGHMQVYHDHGLTCPTAAGADGG